MINLKSTPTVERLDQFMNLRRFDAGIYEIAQRVGKAEFEDFRIDRSHGNETAVTYRLTLDEQNIRNLALSDKPEELAYVFKSSLTTCFAGCHIPPQIKMYQTPPSWDGSRSYLISLVIQYEAMRSVMQRYRIREFYDMVGPNLWPNFVNNADPWTAKTISRYGGLYEDMSTDNLKKLKKFKEIHEYLLFKTTNGPAEITTILRRYDKSYEWEFTVPNIKVDFATRVLGEEIEKILNNEYLFHTSLPKDTSKNYACFTFVLNDADLADIWCNNSVAAVYEVLGKFLATEILDNHELLEQASQRFYQNGIPRSADELGG